MLEPRPGVFESGRGGQHGLFVAFSTDDVQADGQALGGQAGGDAGGGVAYGGVSLLIFGLALSSPLVLAVFTQPGRRLLNVIARFAARMPRITGAVLVLLGVWSIGLAL